MKSVNFGEKHEVSLSAKLRKLPEPNIWLLQTMTHDFKQGLVTTLPRISSVSSWKVADASMLGRVFFGEVQGKSLSCLNCGLG